MKLKFGRYFAADVWLTLWSWILVKILKLPLVKILTLRMLMFGWDFEVDICLIKILKLKFDKDLCKNLWYELNPRVRFAFGNVFFKYLKYSHLSVRISVLLRWIVTVYCREEKCLNCFFPSRGKMEVMSENHTVAFVALHDYKTLGTT